MSILQASINLLLLARNFRYNIGNEVISMTNVMAVVNQKGGVAKTTTAVNLAAALKKRKQKVLLMDFDPQGNAGSGLGVHIPEGAPSLYDALIGEVSLLDILVRGKKLVPDVLPSTVDLAAAELVLGDREDRAFVLRQLLAPILVAYDYVIIDCPPSLGILTVNALTAANRLLVPIQCEYYALEGLSQLMDTIARIQETTNPDLEIGGILMTMHDTRMKLSRQVVDEVRRAFGSKVFQTVIPRNVKLSEAPGFGQSIMEYEPLSKGARAYMALAKEVLDRDKI